MKAVDTFTNKLTDHAIDRAVAAHILALTFRTGATVLDPRKTGSDVGECLADLLGTVKERSALERISGVLACISEAFERDAIASEEQEPIPLIVDYKAIFHNNPKEGDKLAKGIARDLFYPHMAFPCTYCGYPTWTADGCDNDACHGKGEAHAHQNR